MTQSASRLRSVYRGTAHVRYSPSGLSTSCFSSLLVSNSYELILTIVEPYLQEEIAPNRHFSVVVRDCVAIVRYQPISSYYSNIFCIVSSPIIR